MSEPFRPPSAETIALVRQLAERQLTADEFRAYVDAPMSDAEREGIEEQIDWFTRRYPTVRERLAWARRSYARWSRAMPK